jgi:hypothetical protein
MNKNLDGIKLDEVLNENKLKNLDVIPKKMKLGFDLERKKRKGWFYKFISSLSSTAHLMLLTDLC